MANQPLHHEFGSALKAEPAPTGGGTHGGLEETKRFPRCATRPLRAEQKSPLMVQGDSKTMSEKNYPQKDEPKLVFLSRPAPGQKYEDWVDSVVDELFKPGGLADGKTIELRNPQFPGGN